MAILFLSRRYNIVTLLSSSSFVATRQTYDARWAQYGYDIINHSGLHVHAHVHVNVASSDRTRDDDKLHVRTH